MSDHDTTEDLLRRTLRLEADEAYSTLTVDDVRRAAVGQRPRSLWRTAALVAAAAAVLIGAPTALLLRSTGDTPSPGPSPSLTDVPSPSPTQATSPRQTPTKAASSLEGIRRGADVGVPWIGQGAIHVPGAGDVAIPTDTGRWAAFTSYHGGWLIAGAGRTDSDAGGVWLRGGDDRQQPLAQSLQPLAQSGGGIVVSSDGTRTAFLADDEVRIGITSGMGDGENIIPFRSPAATGPIGFLSNERVVCNGLKGQVLVLDAMNDSSVVLSGLSRASGSTQEGGLVAGTTVDDDGTAAVLSASSGKILWTKHGWVTGRFSPDGRFLAAYRSATGGEFETVAILDARSGAVIARNDLRDVQALPDLSGPQTATSTAWDLDGSLLIPYRDGTTWAILRLTTAGQVTRASDVFEGNPYDDNLVFAARP